VLIVNYLIENLTVTFVKAGKALFRNLTSALTVMQLFLAARSVSMITPPQPPKWPANIVAIITKVLALRLINAKIARYSINTPTVKTVPLTRLAKNTAITAIKDHTSAPKTRAA